MVVEQVVSRSRLVIDRAVALAVRSGSCNLDGALVARAPILAAAVFAAVRWVQALALTPTGRVAPRHGRNPNGPSAGAPDGPAACAATRGFVQRARQTPRESADFNPTVRGT